MDAQSRAVAVSSPLAVSLVVFCVLLTACASHRPSPGTGTGKGGGGYYQDDGPGANAPTDIAAIPDATPRREPLARGANNPYTVFGREYMPLREVKSFRQRGVASWYGRKFHGQKTSSGETYDMYAMTAAHPTLPIPSYARVSNPANGKSVVVRINDRGPFLGGRIVDLSYSAAWKLGLVAGGSGAVVLDSIVPGAPEPAPVTAIAAASPSPSVRTDVPGEDIDSAITRLAARAEVPALPQVSEGKDTWLQLGAFANRDNAESFRQHMASQLSSLGDNLIVRAQGNINRVQLGPYRDAAEARRIAEQIREALAMPTVVVH